MARKEKELTGEEQMKYSLMGMIILVIIYFVLKSKGVI